MADSVLFDGEHCPRCGREVVEDSSEKWATILRCPEGHFSRQSDYQGVALLDRD